MSIASAIWDKVPIVGDFIQGAGGAISNAIFGDGSVRQRENNFIQNAENQHWARVAAKRDLNTAQKLHVLENRQMADQYRNQFGWLVEGAQKAGFNPLTALGTASTHGGGSAGGGMTPLAAHVPSPVDMGQAIGDLGSFMSSLDPIERERRELENELARRRIEQIDSEQTRLGQMPEVRRTASEVQGGDSQPITNGNSQDQELIQEIIPGDQTSSGIDLANPDVAPEAETDIWAWLRDATFGENIRKVIRNNLRKQYAKEYKSRDDRYNANLGSPARNTRPGYGSKDATANLAERRKHFERMKRWEAEHKNAAEVYKLTGKWPAAYVRKHNMERRK